MEKKEKISKKEFNQLIKDQFEETFYDNHLAIDDKTKELLLPQTILGNAQKGHRKFYQNARPETTMTDIIQALNMNPEIVRQERQELMEDFKNCILDIFLHGKETLTNRDGKPIYGVKFLEDFQIKPTKEFFQGGALVGRMDTAMWRQCTKRYSPKNLKGKLFELGCGEEHPINTSELERLYLNVTKLAEEPHSKQDLKEKGIIVNKERLALGPPYENLFVRYEKGLGVCDDMALTSIGLIYGKPAAHLGFCIDATDTYTKFCKNEVEGGYDKNRPGDIRSSCLGGEIACDACS